MDASVNRSEVALDTTAAHHVPATAIVLSTFGTSTLKKLTSRSTEEIALLSEMWQDVQIMKAQETSEEKGFTYRDAGFLLALPGGMAEEFVTSICVENSYQQGAVKTNEMQEKQLKLQYDRMKLRKMPRNGALHAEHIYKQIKGWGEVENKRVLLRDLASLMQLGDGPTAEIFRRLKKAESEEKTKGEKDTRGTAHDAEPPGLGKLSIHHALNIQSSAGMWIPSSNDATHDKRKPEADNTDDKAKAQEDLKTKKPRGRYQPWVGEWKCSVCGYWNSPSCDTCLGTKPAKCEGRKDLHTAEIQLDDGNHRKFHNPNEDPKVFAGDWQCRCGRWKPIYCKECGCGWCRNASNRVMQPGPNKVFRRESYVNKRNPAFAW
ncbi:predicted protein [Plenodomus lingam JN3]|uniref:Predicted protein n=1 Tax=Leptosphaeria maculans (strain JN3 / isolate v23.1.3 / race Av1-4-5-6-7-8) TaxID=985895 RepID=E5A3K4_LEPMJ|nr:predicted protein [Plenodomus lingam JN3]CBX98217.1 predicted protein [Plenodomus lingam JN3]